MEQMKNKFFDELIEISEKKYKCLEEMYLLTKGQATAINEDDIDKLNEYINEKEGKITQINNLDCEFETCFKDIKNELGVSSLDELDNVKIDGTLQLKQSIAKITNIITDIIHIENENNKKIRKQLDDISISINKIRYGQKANNAYGGGPLQEPAHYIQTYK